MEFRFCPKCGSALAERPVHGEVIPVCTRTECGFHFWQNSKPCATTVIENADSQLLLGIRSIDPERGKLDFIGGFLKAGEVPVDGASREAKEELGVEVSIVRFLGIVTDRYDYQDIRYWTLNVGYLARLGAGELAIADDINGVEWIDPHTVDRRRLAFTNNEQFLDMYLESRP